MTALSIIVPVYNVVEFLPQCVESILAQTYTDFELILADDGSTDGSGALCDRLALRDSRIRVLHQENSGVVAARRSGVRLAKGAYIGFVDGDDWVEPDMYALLMRAAEHCDLAVCGFSIDYPDCSHPVHNSLLESDTADGRVWEFYDGAALRWRLHPNTVNKVFRRDILLPILERADDRITFGEDAALTLPYLLRTGKIVLVPQSLYHYRQRRNSITRAYDPALPERIAVLTAFLRRAFQNAPQGYAAQLAQYFGYLEVLLAKNESRLPGSVRDRARRLRTVLPPPKVPGVGGLCPRRWNFDTLLLFLLRHGRYVCSAALLGLWRRRVGLKRL